jgi:prophage regulatory protein
MKAAGNPPSIRATAVINNPPSRIPTDGTRGTSKEKELSIANTAFTNTSTTAAIATQSASAQRVSLDVKDVAQILGICSRGVYRLLNEGNFPKPRKIGRLSRWDRTEVLNWWDERAAS